jgi:hypothetical protein
MTTSIKLKRSSVGGKAPTVEQLELGELAINTYDGELYLKRNQGALEEIVKFVGKVPIDNVYFVQKSGIDTNDGVSWDTAFATIEKALEVVAARNNELTLIDIGPGEYVTQGHLDMPDNCIIRAVHRSVVIKPEAGYEERNVFRMGSGCFLEGPIFEGWRLDSLDNPTAGFAVSFRPGAVIRRAPYAHKIAVRTVPYWDNVPPPLDRDNGNPLVGRGAGVVLADGLVCSPYSIYPNIMTWGATPVTHNGIGYVAKNGAMINAVNAISIWCHKHFLAQSGGQILLSSCATQFGDFTLVAEGNRNIAIPTELEDLSPPVNINTFTPSPADANTIIQARSTIIDDLWDELVFQGYAGNTEVSNTAVLDLGEDQEYTRRDANTFIQVVSWIIETGDETPAIDFAKGFFDPQANLVFTSDKLDSFIFSFEYMRDEINALGIGAPSQAIVTGIVDALTDTLQNPVTRSEPSVITAIGHTWTAIMSGVALTKIPPAGNETTIQESILELSGGVVIASGQDDQGSALFIGGMEINADTGELSGPPFEKAVNRIATRTAIARSF